MFEKFRELFDMDKFPIDNGEKHNPVNQMFPMQKYCL